MMRIKDVSLSSSSKLFTFKVVRMVVFVGLSPFSDFVSLACLLAAEYEVPQMSDPPVMKLIMPASLGGDAALSGMFVPS